MATTTPQDQATQSNPSPTISALDLRLTSIDACLNRLFADADSILCHGRSHPHANRAAIVPLCDAVEQCLHELYVMQGLVRETHMRVMDGEVEVGVTDAGFEGQRQLVEADKKLWKVKATLELTRMSVLGWRAAIEYNNWVLGGY
jgi:hypothetical protein